MCSGTASPGRGTGFVRAPVVFSDSPIGRGTPSLGAGPSGGRVAGRWILGPSSMCSGTASPGRGTGFVRGAGVSSGPSIDMGTPSSGGKNSGTSVGRLAARPNPPTTTGSFGASDVRPACRPSPPTTTRSRGASGVRPGSRPTPPTTTASLPCTGLREGSRPIPPTTVSVPGESSGAACGVSVGLGAGTPLGGLVGTSSEPAPRVRVAEGPSRPTPRMTVSDSTVCPGLPAA
jgi:hypothetical protein